MLEIKRVAFGVEDAAARDIGYSGIPSPDTLRNVTFDRTCLILVDTPVICTYQRPAKHDCTCVCLCVIDYGGWWFISLICLHDIRRVGVICGAQSDNKCNG